MPADSPDYDFVILGATGFTGRLVMEYVYSTYGLSSDLKWAIAGRNEEKLRQVRAEVAGTDAEGVPMIVADSTNAESLEDLVSRTRVVCTTVGPYARYGSGLVEACAKAGTHYCDLTGEVQWMRRMIDAWHTTAEQSGARIVHTCGFDSIPSDLGTLFMQQAMHERHGVWAKQVKFRVGKTRGGMSGGTVESLMNLMEEASEDKQLRELLSDPYSLNPVNLPPGKDKTEQMSAVYDTDFRKWTAPFVMAGINTRVVRRSHALMGFPWGADFRYDESMLTGDGPGGYMAAAGISGASLAVMAGAALGPTRRLLRAMAPSPGEGPSRKMIETGFFNIELLARHPDDASKDLRGRVTGDRDPGYGATSKMLAESAICLAKDDLDSGGGVLTPSTAMGRPLIDRLIKSAGMRFDLI